MGNSQSRPDQPNNNEENAQNNIEEGPEENVEANVVDNLEENVMVNEEDVVEVDVEIEVEDNEEAIEEANIEESAAENPEEPNEPTEPPRSEPSSTRDVGTSTDITIQAVVEPPTPQNNEYLYVNEIYDHLYDLERRHPIPRDHLAGQQELTYRMRAVLIDWINEVHLSFEMQPETFQLAVAIIDRFLEKVKNTRRTALQLVGVTALYMATKYLDRFKPPISEVVSITNNTYTAQEICQMELLIFKTVDYNLSRPVPLNFLQRCLKAGSLSSDGIHNSMALYLIELAAVEYDLSSYFPSEIAAAALFLSLHLLTYHLRAGMGFNDQLWSPSLTFYSRYSASHLRPITWQLAKVAKSASQARPRAVYRKYLAYELHQAALRTRLAGSWLEAIVS